MTDVGRTEPTCADAGEHDGRGVAGLLGAAAAASGCRDRFDPDTQLADATQGGGVVRTDEVVV